MAQRRMFSIKIIDSARFLKMPSSTRLLYYDLGMRADDDGVVEAFNVLRMTGSTEDDLRVLVSKGFVEVLNDDLVTYINDWNEHNKIRADRKVDSMYKDLLLRLKPDVRLIESRPRADLKPKIEENTCPMDVQLTDNGQVLDENGQHRIGKDRIGKVSEGKDSIGNNKKEKSGINALIDSYTRNQALIDCIKEFIKMRAAKKKPVTDRALKLIFDKLDKLESIDEKKIRVLEQSIENCWTGVFPLKEEKGGMNNVNNGGSKDPYDPFDI